MTDLVDDGIVPTTIMLSGSSIMSGGNTITNRYLCNLDCLSVGSKVGMMRKSDGMLHFFINGEDMGAAPIEVPSSVFAVIDLYGQCAQVSITRVGDVSLVSSQAVDSLSFPFNDTSHRFSVCCGKNIVLKNNNLTATRIRHYNNALIFSSAPLDFDETFEVSEIVGFMYVGRYLYPSRYYNIMVIIFYNVYIHNTSRRNNLYRYESRKLIPNGPVP